MVYTCMRHGEFDPPAMNPYTKLDMSQVQSDTHRQLAITTAINTFVLLKNNNNVLPIKTQMKTIAVSIATF